MQTIISRKDLQALVSTAIRFTSRNSTLMVLTMFLVEAVQEDSTLRIHATNLERGIVLKAKVANASNWAICVDAQKFTDFVSRFTGEKVNLELKKDVLNIQCGSSVVNLRGLDPQEFPPVAPQKISGKMEDIQTDELQTAAGRVAFAAIQDQKARDSRPHLGAVYFTGKAAEATDGFIVALNTFTGLKGALVSSESIVEAGKVFKYAESIRACFQGGKVILVSDWVLMVCNALDLPFPDVSMVLPKTYTNFAKLQKVDLLSAISQAMVVASDERVSKKLRLSFDDVLGILNISTRDEFSGDISIDIPMELKGKALEIFINGDYLKSAVERVSSETIEIKTTVWDKPLEISEDPDWRCVIMPMGKF